MVSVERATIILWSVKKVILKTPNLYLTKPTHVDPCSLLSNNSAENNVQLILDNMVLE